MLVSLNGVTQAPETAFTVSGSNITFSSALTSSDVIDYILVLGDVLSVGTPSDGTVGTSQMSYPLDNFSSTGIDDNATSTAITIDSNENVGIGTTSPDTPLHVLTNSSGYAITIEENSGTEAFQIGVDSVGSLDFFNTKAGTSHLSLVDNGDTIITGGGSVGIGTASPASLLES